MALDDVTQKIWNEIEAVTKPNADVEAIRLYISAAKEAISNHYASRTVKHTGFISKVEGPAIIERLEEFSEVYLKAAGKPEANRKLYANTMIGLLNKAGDGVYQRFEDAIKEGNIDEALRLANESLRVENMAAEYGPIVSRVGKLSPAQRDEFGKELAARIESITGEKGYDPFKILGNMYSYLSALREIKSAFKPFAANG